MNVTTIPPALEITNLSYAYRGHWLIKRKQTLSNLTLSVSAGESFGFLGHNGAGKTSTIKSILGINKTHQGSIRVFGIPHTESAARRLIGYLPELPYFYDHLTVTEILAMYATLAGVATNELHSECARVLDLVKISGRRKSPIRSLSKGLTQRIAMAQALLGTPKMLILDEPFSGLDPLGRRDFKELLSQLKQDGTTIFMSSHILSDVEFLCNRVSIMSKGQIQGIFTIKEITSLNAARFEVTVESCAEAKKLFEQNNAVYREENEMIISLFENRDQAQHFAQLVIAANLRLDSFNSVQNSLEDVFVKLVQFDESAER